LYSNALFGLQQAIALLRFLNAFLLGFHLCAKSPKRLSVKLLLHHLKHLPFIENRDPDSPILPHFPAPIPASIN
jgi:hypothetical protein